jgi:hypothetical protein
MPERSLWTLINFEQALDRWIDTDGPDEELRNVILNWLLSRLDDPYQGVLREPSFS